MTVQTTAPPLDVVGDVLRSIRLEGTLYFAAHVEAPWGIHIPDSGVANFHLVTSGSCWVDTGDGPSLQLAEGDAVVFPHSMAHSLAHEPGQPGIDGRALFSRMDEDGVVQISNDGGDATTIICGHFSYDQRLGHPLLDALPNVIHTRAGRHSGWKTIAEIAVDRSKRLAPGSAALTDRLAEVLLIELLSDFGYGEIGFMTALQDPVVATTLHAIHEHPDRDWTVAGLARHAVVSRSTLATRFTELVGESPIRYLTRWRIHTAARMLRESSRPAGEVGHAVGYSSPFAFSKAFTREVGLAPSQYRTRNADG